MRLKLHKIGLLALAAIVAAFFFGRFGQLWWVADLFSHWYLQYFVGAAIILLYAVILRDKMLAIFALATSAYLGAQFLPIMPEEVGEVDIYFINALYSNENVDAILADIEERKPNYVSVVELNDELSSGIQELGFHAISEFGVAFDRQGFFGRREFSYYPEIIDVLNSENYPISRVKIHNVYVYTVHPFPPLNGEAAQKQKQLFKAVSSLIDGHEQRGQRFVLLGDFNSTAFSPVFRSYFAKYNPQVLYSWNVQTPLKLPIDYAISNFSMRVQTGEQVGSDHLPLYVDL